MFAIACRLWNDEAGFLISGELVLVSTILTLSMVVGLSEVSHAVNQELADVASAFGAVNQSYRYPGLFSDSKGGHHGGGFSDHADFCDNQWGIAGTRGRGEH